MDTLIFSLIFALLCLILAVLAKPADQRIGWAGVILFTAYLALDDLATGLPNLIPALDFLPGSWNWSGKVLSLAVAVLTMFALGLSPDAIGLRRQQHPKIAWIAVALFVVWGTTLGLLFQPGAADLETFAFQATMPGLAEEIAYRGIAPAILLSLFQRKPHVDGIPWAVIIATSVLFGLWHSLEVKNGEVGFNLMSGLFPFIGSIPGGWLRFKTKSLLVPILGHGVANVAFHAAGTLAG